MEQTRREFEFENSIGLNLNQTVSHYDDAFLVAIGWQTDRQTDWLAGWLADRQSVDTRPHVN